MGVRVAGCGAMRNPARAGSPNRLSGAPSGRRGSAVAAPAPGAGAAQPPPGWGRGPPPRTVGAGAPGGPPPEGGVRAVGEGVQNKITQANMLDARRHHNMAVTEPDLSTALPERPLSPPSFDRPLAPRRVAVAIS